MASSINPNNVDGTYPVAGTDNDSQGHRDNYTNIKNNFTSAKTEIEDLQSNAFLKTALSGTSLDNDMGGAIISDFESRDISETRIAKGTTSGTVSYDYSAGPYQTVTTSASITLAFTAWPASGKYGKIRIEITIANVAHTVTLPAAVTLHDEKLQGWDNAGRTITFDTTGTYVFEFTTHDAGTTITIQDLSRASGTFQDVRTPANIGKAGDIAGMLVVDASYVYVSTGTYDGSTVIWKRAAITAF